ncbi:hypothetical protein PCG10_006323 [Penicillium crustosum]|uniref:Myb-like DNA-binding domain-containing protein n=1 Tax=Penicillium crustosum TaxID=36656 RepID=A0A9P5GI88_PENCR|nr:uncharacterized protein N7487_001353 [Penicillium crustosum]KAF7523796.1 hypothetical protein PCG10_006323 [Penicillium crustosum]KAJ5417803.1 hypothetical protein N7487_001353 [Penicillium crustosum]
MALEKATTKSRPANRSRPAAKNNFKDEEVMLLWKILKLNHKEIDIPVLAKELNLSVGAARMRWFRLKAKLDAFEKRATGNETTTATATAAPVDTTMEGTKGAEETDEAEGSNNDEDAK